MEKDIHWYVEYIKSAFNVDTFLSNDGSICVYSSCSNIIPLLSMLKLDQSLKFDCLIDLFAVDYPHKRDRFEVVYLLLSMNNNVRMTVRVPLGDSQDIHTATTLFANANWLEREAFDLYGIKFSNHPDLRRILTDYDFEGHPMLKDFPLSGYTEVWYSNEDGKVVSRPVNLQQGLRSFETLSPWAGQ